MRRKVITDIPLYDGIGIYKITHSITKRVYIGSSVHCNKRLKEHNRMLPNNEMERDGESGSFTAVILQEFPNGCTNRELKEAESFYLKEAIERGEAVYNSPQHSPAHNQVRGAIDEYILLLHLPIDKKEQIKALAESKGYNMKDYILKLIDNDIERGLYG